MPVRLEWIFLISFFFFLSSFITPSKTQPTEKSPEADNPGKTNIFPIIMYDSDIGLGLGAKAVVRNYLEKNESFDVIVFGSSKGEQWYFIQFAIPDNELRQGDKYSLSWNIKMEWDKLLNSNYFGIGNQTPDNEFQFPREFLKIENTFGHAFLPIVIGEIGHQFVHYSLYGFDPAWGTITSETPGAGENQISSFFARICFDNRNSYIHPSRGIRLFLRSTFSRRWMGGDWDFDSYRLESSIYRTVLSHKYILAARLWLQDVRGGAPFPELSKIGDSWTARGYKAERYLDRSMLLSSLEFRFPLYHSLGGVLFMDTGRVSPSLQYLSLQNFHTNWGWGLRYYLTTFVVRFDMGIGPNGSRVFFNFGQVF
jgi:outer membrane protein assembly factor BamA